MRRVLLAAALLAVAAAAGATTLYLRGVVTAEPAGLTLGDLLQVAGELPATARDLLARSAGAPAGRLLVVPAAFYRDLLAGALGGGGAIVGSRALVVPTDLAPAELVPLLVRLVDWLEVQGGFGRGAVEIELVLPPDRGSPAADVATFTLVRAERSSGLFNGVVEVTVGAPGARSARVSLRVRQALPSFDEGVRSGETVQVRFLRGAVTIEMEGRALSSAAPGQPVSVWVADSRRSFAGTATGRKVVDVVLP